MLQPCVYLILMSGKLGAYELMTESTFTKRPTKMRTKIYWLLTGDGLELIYRGFLPRRGLDISALHFERVLIADHAISELQYV